MIAMDAFSCYASMYFVAYNFNVADAFEKLTAGRRAEGIPSEVMNVRSDDREWI